MTADDIKDLLLLFGMGFGFGFITIGISGASQGLTGVPLGFSQFNFKNIVKSGTLNGATLVGLSVINEKFGISQEFADQFDI